MIHNHWFISRQKCTFDDLIDILMSFREYGLNKKWTMDVQLSIEDDLTKKGIIKYKERRSREVKQGGGGVRTLWALLRSLGFVFLDEQKIVRFTYAAIDLLEGNEKLYDIVRNQLIKFQYPSYSSTYNKRSSVSTKFKVHPFWLILKLLCDDDIKYLKKDEYYCLLVSKGTSDSDRIYKNIKKEILKNRKENKLYDKKQLSNNEVQDSRSFLTLLKAVDLIKVDKDNISIVSYNLTEVKEITQEKIPFISKNYLSSEKNYQMKYGCTKIHKKDNRTFEKKEEIVIKNKTQERIFKKYLDLIYTTPKIVLNDDLIDEIYKETLIPKKEVFKWLSHFNSTDNVDMFYSHYKDIAELGTEENKEFEIMTKQLFEKVFDCKSSHVGNKPLHPDVYVLDDIVLGLIDNKAYKKKFSINVDFRNKMTENYIPIFTNENNKDPKFFMYISNAFGPNINKQISEISNKSNVFGCVISTNNLIHLAKLYDSMKIDKYTLLNLFCSNKEVEYKDFLSFMYS